MPANQHIIRPFIVGVCGGTASGKTTVCEILVKNLAAFGDIKIVHQGNFYKHVADGVDVSTYNFDHPDALDYELMVDTFASLKEGRPTQIPVYDLKNSKRLSRSEIIQPFRVILLEGTLVMYSKQLRELMDLTVFVDCDSDTRLCRRVTRDMEVYNRDLVAIINQYISYVKPAFEDFVMPSKKYADIIIPRGAENTIAIELIAQHVRDVLFEGYTTHSFELKHKYTPTNYHSLM